MTSPETQSSVRTAAQLRRAFLDYFIKNGHTEVPSSPLVPGDPTLLFTTAGMVQFKPYYSAAGDVPYTRAVSIQKCLRLTDLENVGLTPRHDTFFEMLGNFSFGPRAKGAYFKEEAIAFAWEFVTHVLGLPRSRLCVSIFEGEGTLPRDEEAIALWKKVGMPADRIVPLGRADNFWGPAGGAGACGPSSEIYFDLGEKRPEYLSEGAFWGEKPGDAGDRYMEFWNLVFPQYDAQKDGSLERLPRAGIDTGMGLERLALIVQGKSTIFETDLFEPLVRQVLSQAPAARVADRDGASVSAKAALRDARMIADHVRALTFAIAEGALPGNEGAGYVLRRLLRRAGTRGRSRQSLSIQHAFLSSCAATAVREFGGHYRELEEQRERLLRVLDQEEAGFTETYETGLARLEQLLSGGAKRLTGRDAFALHDTYGFPIELTEEIAAERGVEVDRTGFERAMEEQRRRARAASKFAGASESGSAPWNEWTAGPDSRFTGYERLAADHLHVRRWREADDELDLVLDRTPCYAESGGQVADRGRITGEGAEATLTRIWREGESIVHRVRLVSGHRDPMLLAGREGRLQAAVEVSHRVPTQRHHTATHLLHAVLRHELGAHVRQAGSLVAPDRLRFDYTHFEAPSAEQLASVERRINEWVLADRAVRWDTLPIDEARSRGATALFGEKYGAEVRMVTVEGVEDLGLAPSLELCGGTHVGRTGEIGAFVIVSDGAIASGVRRIEALCGHQALRHFRAERELLARAAEILQASPVQLPEQIGKLKGEVERLRKTQAELRSGELASEMAKLAEGAISAPGGRWVVASIEADADGIAVREAADSLRSRLGRGAALLAVAGGGKLTFVAAVTDDLVAGKKLRADDLVRAVAKIAGGSGGGKPHLALAGAKQPEKLGEALAEARRLIQHALGA
ncbi:MAG: alanine--tRNA ligase [Candidatus Eisenbacteria bacterium]|nr:alanine--tRNA ligase [Candidatus Eisenbacteria bacterium]